MWMQNVLLVNALNLYSFVLKSLRYDHKRYQKRISEKKTELNDKYE